MLHSIPSVCGGFLRDLLVTVNYWSPNRETPLHDALINDYDFGKGWKPLFGVGADGWPRKVVYQKSKKGKSGGKKARRHAFNSVSDEPERPQGFAAALKANGLQFRPEFNKFQDFFGRARTTMAPWVAVLYSLEQLDTSNCRNFRPERDAEVLKGMIEAVQQLKQWYDQVLSERPDAPTVRVLGHSLWKFWNKMITTVFPLDPRRLHETVLEAGFHMSYDPRPFAIGPAAHAALVHCDEWITAVGPELFAKQIEKGGEHALNRVSGLTAVLPIPRFGHLERPGIHLAYALASNLGKAIAAATVARDAAAEEIQFAEKIGEAMIDSSCAEVGNVQTSENLAWMVAGMRLASSLPSDAERDRVSTHIGVQAARQRNPAPGLGESRGPHPYTRRPPKVVVIDRQRYKDDGVEPGAELAASAASAKRSRPPPRPRPPAKRAPRPKRSRRPVEVSSSDESDSPVSEAALDLSESESDDETVSVSSNTSSENTCRVSSEGSQ